MSTSGTIKRRTLITGVDNPAYQVSKDEANDSLVVAGSIATGAPMVRDTTQADGWGFFDAGALGDLLFIGAGDALTALTAAAGIPYWSAPGVAPTVLTIGTGLAVVGSALTASGGIAGGSPTQVQYNAAGALAGDAGLTYDPSTDTLTAGIFAGSGSGLTIPETAITDGALLARLAAAEIVAGAWTFTAAPTITRANLVATSTDGLVLQNTTPATSGVPVQISPRVRLVGTAWDTAASQTVAFYDEVVPQNAGTPSGRFNTMFSLNGAAGVQVSTLTSGGAVTFTGTIATSGGDFQAPAAGAILWAGRCLLSCPADAQINFRNAGLSAGVGFDISTDAVLMLRTRAQSAYATLDVLGLKASGVAGASGTFSSVTVVNGVVTAGT